MNDSPELESFRTLVNAEIAAVRREIEFGDKAQAQSVALMAPVLQRMTDDLAELKRYVTEEIVDMKRERTHDRRKREDAKDDSFKTLRNALYLVAVTVVAAVIIAGLTQIHK